MSNEHDELRITMVSLMQVQADVQLTRSIASFSSGVTAMVSAASAIWSSMFLVQEVKEY